MSGIRNYTPGMRLRMQGRNWVISKLAHGTDGVTTVWMTGDQGERLAWSISELMATNVEVIGEAEPPLTTVPPESLSPERIKKLRKQAGHLNEVLTGCKSGNIELTAAGEPRPGYEVDPTNPSTGLDFRVQLKAAELKISGRSVYRQLKQYTPHDITSLLTEVERRHLIDPLAGVDPIYIEAAEQIAGETDHLSRRSRTYFRQMTLRRVEELMNKKVAELRQAGRRKDAQQILDIQVPNRNQFNALLKVIEDKHHRGQSVKSALTNIDVPNWLGRGFNSLRLNELVLVDETPTNVLLRSDIDGTQIRCAIVAAVEAYSKVAGAIEVVPRGTAIDIAILLFDMLWPKMAELDWPEIARWQYPGAPEQLLVADKGRGEGPFANMPPVDPDRVYVDNGMIMVGDVALLAIDRLEMSVGFARQATGADKALVERLFGKEQGS